MLVTLAASPAPGGRAAKATTAAASVICLTPCMGCRSSSISHIFECCLHVLPTLATDTTPLLPYTHAASLYCVVNPLPWAR
jgi:hypothetical protein